MLPNTPAILMQSLCSSMLNKSFGFTQVKYITPKLRQTPIESVWALWNFACGGHLGLNIWVCDQSETKEPTELASAVRVKHTRPAVNAAILAESCAIAVRYFSRVERTRPGLSTSRGFGHFKGMNSLVSSNPCWQVRREWV